jgi:cobalamin biosynthetic protein CobC
MEPDGGAIHGGALDEARRRHPHAPEPWIDLSTGINPVPYSLPSLAPESWERLPLASEELDLRRAAAARYGVSAPDMIAAAPGTQALIQIIPRLLQPTRAAVVGPTTYAEHLMAWAREGHEARGVETLAEAAAANVVVAVNPDNPTGRLIPVADLLSVAWALASRGGLLVVDEAFMDTLDPAASLAPVLPPATLVLRSFGKIFGLAGVRLGFAIADRTTSGRLREMLGPWAVSGPALAIGRRALMDGAWLLEARQRLAADALRLDALIAQAGGRVLGGSTLFRLAAHSDAGRVADGLAERGVLVRRFPSQPAWLRFGIPGTEDAWRRLEAALRETTLDETRTP